MRLRGKIKKVLKKVYVSCKPSKTEEKVNDGVTALDAEEGKLLKDNITNSGKAITAVQEDPSVNCNQLRDDTLSEQEYLEIEQEHIREQELAEARERYQGLERDNIWAFVSGQNSEDFRGNPKYLFVYINRYRSDIAAYWLCNSEETLEQVRSLGFVAHKLNSPAAQYAINRTGVLVAEQVKAFIPDGFENVKYLNLWHGVGDKKIERKLFLGDISMGLARKYIELGTFYRDHQLMVVTSPTNEKENMEDCGIDAEKFIHSGYLRCMYQQNFEPIHSFDSDLRNIKGLSADTKMIVYAPTYRAKLGGTFSKAMVDLEALYQCCERNNLLLIFKVHPVMGNEEGFLRAAETYGDRPRFWFWDNQDDFYEIMDQMDLAIIDYSAIFSDFVAVGIKHYIRYIYDYDEYMQEGFTQGEYFERTAGKVCYTFEELIKAIDTYQERDESEELQQIKEKLWAFAGGKDDFDKTIQQVMDFKVETREFPTLYSFDVFDTLISRDVLDPIGIFYDVQEKAMEYGGFPYIITHSYATVRHAAESNVREFYGKTTLLRKSESVEITFDEIFERMASVYNLSEQQIALLKQWELESEYDSVIPLKEQIQLVKDLVAANNKVVLISDMYLPKDFIQKLLKKADPILAELPLFVSNDYGVLKTSQKLFFEVYKSFEPFYDFKKWIHYGDNPKADQIQPQKFKINTRKISVPQFNGIQEQMIEYAPCSDFYKVAAAQARMQQHAIYEKDEFVISYVTLCMVPYIDWVLRDAEIRNYDVLYFISRDGHHLKRIADVIIKERGLKFKTKYIYASRRAWRLPSFITEVDEGFWTEYGSFADIVSKKKLLRAMNLNEEKFREFFPTIDPDEINFRDKKALGSCIEIFKESKEYNEYLLKKAAKERILVEGYLKQEIDFNENFAIVEYYGRGYTQDALINLCQHITNREMDVPFYYSRSVLPTMGHAIRYNFTTNSSRQFFLESIFANMPYRSVEKYKVEDGKIVPDIRPIPYNHELFDSMERLLPEFAKQFAMLDLKHPEDTDRLLYDFMFAYYANNLKDKEFAENIGSLVDSVALYGKKREYAPAFTMENLEQFAAKEISRTSGKLTYSTTMSVIRASEEVQNKYYEMFQLTPFSNLASGRLLSETEIALNNKYKDKYENLMETAEVYSNLYQEDIKQYPVQGDKVLLITAGSSLKNTSLKLVYYKLSNMDELKMKVIRLKNTKKTTNQIVKELATARFILISSPIKEFCKINFRPETQVILLNNEPLHLYNQKLAVNYPLKWKQDYCRLAATNDISILQIPSAYQEERFRKNYSKSAKTECSLYGCCNTDVYYEENSFTAAREKLISVFPEAEGKKVIAYMPTIRKRKSCKEWLQIIDMEVLQKLIGEEYVVVLNFNLNQMKQMKYSYKNKLNVEGFSKWIKRKLSPRELLLAADVVVGDYRDTFFESAFLNKPVYFTSADYENIIKGNNMPYGYEYESYIFGPVITTAEDLVKQLNVVDKYNYEPMRKFREKMFSDCDGRSTDRVVEHLMSNRILSDSE